MHKIDYKKLREDIRASYANHLPGDDAILAYEARNAGVIADLCVMVVREDDSDLPLTAQLDGIAAVFSIVLFNIAMKNGIDKIELAEAMGLALQQYLRVSEASSDEIVLVNHVDVGDA